MTPLDAARAALAPAAPEWRVVIAAQLLAETMRAAQAAGVLADVLGAAALEVALRAAEAAIDGAETPALRPGDEVLFHPPCPSGHGLAPPRRGVVAEIAPDSVAVAIGPRARIRLPRGAIVRNFRLNPEKTHG